MPTVCCVVGCNSQCTSTYRFPARPHELVRRKKWISAVGRTNDDGTPWQPSKTSRICSDHFISRKKHDHPEHPDYVPSIFPHNTKERKSDGINRFLRRQGRNENKSISVVHQEEETNFPEAEKEEYFADKCFQISQNFNEHKFEFSLERDGNNVATQASISTQVSIAIPVPKMSSDAATSTEEKKLLEGFRGMESIKEEKQLISLSGVTFAIFKTFQNLVSEPKKQKIITKENKLLIILMKLKLGLTYAALGALFQIHATTVSKIFNSLVRELAQKTRQLIFWPSKNTINATMPMAFKVHFPATRVILDCTEIRVEQPRKISDRNWLYSNYKGGYTVKFLIGISPNGFICFLSKCYGGRASDTFITIDSGLPQLLEPGDSVLADKGFPGIQTALQNSIVITPPFVHQGHLTPQEVELTYNIASVRIHVERCIQRIKIFNILKLVPISLLPLIDDVVHICSVITNMQAPIIKAND